MRNKVLQQHYRSTYCNCCHRNMSGVCSCVLISCLAAVTEAVQKWRTEKEARLSGDKPEEDEEEESIYSAHHEEVSVHLYPGGCPSQIKWTSGLLIG